MFDETHLDSELIVTEDTSSVGLERINKARQLLPIYYRKLIEEVGDVDGGLDLDRLPPAIKGMTDLFQAEVPALGLSANATIASLTYANLLGKFRPYILEDAIAKQMKVPCNLLVLHFSGSGNGKNLSFDLGSTVLKDADNLVKEAMLIEAEQTAKGKAIAKSKKKTEKEKTGGKPGPANELADDAGWEELYEPPSNGLIKMATYEAFLAEAKKIETNGKKGNLFVLISELGNSLSLDPNIDRFVMIYSEMYDTGQAPEDLKKTKELKTGAIEGLAPSMLAHTSPAPLLKDPKLVLKLKTIMSSYFARRAYTLVSDLNDTTKGIELSEDISEQIKSMLSKTFTNVEAMSKLSKEAVAFTKRLLDNEDATKITLTDEAKELYAFYYLLNKNYRSLAYLKDESFVTDGLLTELTNRHWRAIKLAGL